LAVPAGDGFAFGVSWETARLEADTTLKTDNDNVESQGNRRRTMIVTLLIA
jgi:hypothetical protein